MSLYENTIKMYQNIAPDMKFSSACKLAEEAVQHSNDISRQNYVILLLLEMIGVDDNGHFPDWMKEKAVTNIKYMFAIHQAGLCHGGHACGFPGYKESMNHYYDLFLRHKFHETDNLKQRQEEYKQQLKEKV